MRHKKRLLLGVLLSIIVGNTTLIFFIVAMMDKQASDQLRLLRDDKENAIIKELQGRVESAHAILRHFSETYEDQEDARRKSMDALASMRFGLNNYFWIHEVDPKRKNSGRFLVHPGKKFYNKRFTDLIDLNTVSSLYHQGKIYDKDDPEVAHIHPTNLFEKFNTTCLLEGEGVVAYYWPKIYQEKTSSAGFLKLSYVKYFPKWQWVVGAGSYADHIDQLVSIETRRVESYKKTIIKQSIVIMALVSCLILIFVFIQINASLRTQMRAEKALFSAKEAAEKSNTAKSEFLANISHEIRTPMNSIMGMTTLLLKSNLDSNQRKYLEMTKASTDRLLLVINDILDFSRIEKGKFTVKETVFRIHDVIDELLITMEVHARAKNLELRASISPKVPEVLKGDVDRLHQVLVNILGNAIKFTEHGSVEIEITYLTSQDPSRCSLHFQVTDTGIGIPEDKHTSIFHSFSQVDTSYSRKHGGTGLGLAVSKNIVQMLGGDIGVDSTPGKGSAFWFTANFSWVKEDLSYNGERAPTARLPAMYSDVCFKDKKVLVADDELLNRVLARTLLEEKKIQVKEACDGIEVLKMVENETFDLILMDIQMPELDGITATSRIRSFEKNTDRHTPILALTAHALESDKQKCLDCGMDDYISKPIDMDNLYTTIARHLAPTSSSGC